MLALFDYSQIPGPLLGHWITCLPGGVINKLPAIVVCYKGYRGDTPSFHKFNYHGLFSLMGSEKIHYLELKHADSQPDGCRAS